MEHPIAPAADRHVGDELAECLQRFLAASVDERTMARAQQAVDHWYQLTERLVVQR